jgi:hypothetical protein
VSPLTQAVFNSQFGSYFVGWQVAGSESVVDRLREEVVSLRLFFLSQSIRRLP